SLSIWRLVEGTRAADVGSGGGFPGIPLAIALGACRWTLIERNARKARFLREVQRRLGLDNVEVLEGDVMEVAATQFDTVVARAYAPAEIALKAGARLCRPGGVMLLMAGRPGSLPEHPGFGQADSLEVWVPILNRAHGVHRFRKSPSEG
ncbi:MAG: RsmG family class I SAM-dependent methyltransferase, partial [Pseudomonadales bacterium]